MKRLPFLLLLLALSLTALTHEAICKDEDIYLTGQNLNGRAWNVWTEGKKYAYITGFREGLLSFILETGVTASNYEAYESLFFPQVTQQEFQDLLTNFYKDPANVKIPIIHGMGCVRAKVLGMTEKELDELVSSYRARYNNPLLKKEVPPQAESK